MNEVNELLKSVEDVEKVWEEMQARQRWLMECVKAKEVEVDALKSTMKLQLAMIAEQLEEALELIEGLSANDLLKIVEITNGLSALNVAKQKTLLRINIEEKLNVLKESISKVDYALFASDAKSFASGRMGIQVIRELAGYLQSTVEMGTDGDMAKLWLDKAHKVEEAFLQSSRDCLRQIIVSGDFSKMGMAKEALLVLEEADIKEVVEWTARTLLADYEAVYCKPGDCDLVGLEGLPRRMMWLSRILENLDCCSGHAKDQSVAGHLFGHRIQQAVVERFGDVTRQGIIAHCQNSSIDKLRMAVRSVIDFEEHLRRSRPRLFANADMAKFLSPVFSSQLHRLVVLFWL